MKRAGVVVGCTGLALLLSVAPVWGSLFGEENVTLVQILAQLMHARQELEDLNETASHAADLTRDVLTTYQRVNAGMEELKNYSFDAFLEDFTTDLYHQYPGFEKLQYASKNLERWAETRTRSPFTAYQAITAVVADVSKPLREDVRGGSANIDRELILSSEAAGGFAAAYTAEASTKALDAEMEKLARAAQHASPGEAAQIQARAAVLAVAQQSHMMRLLARTVRLDSVQAALAYGDRMHARNALYERQDAITAVAKEALKPPAMVQFGEL